MEKEEAQGEGAAFGGGRSGRIMLGLLLALLLARVLFAIWPFRTVVATADPYSYIRFARALAEGRFFDNSEVSQAVQALWSGDQLTDGPVWNTHVRSDGRTVHTIAIGFPLVLAGAIQGLGLTAALYLNHFLLVGVLGMILLCAWEGWGRSNWALVFGAMATLAFLYSAPATFLQFSRPWREPLFYICVLGALYALLRFLREERAVFLFLLGLLAGYACSIKEANIVYAAWLGLYLLCSGPFRASPRKALLLGAGALGGLVGLAPILIQNLVGTGNPFLSLQFAHSASNYTAPPAEGPILGPVPGLTASNILSIYLRYIDLYAAYGGPLFSWPALLIGGVGVFFAAKSHAGRLFLGLGLVHAVLYAQWGNADFRHMFFAHVPYAVLVTLPLFLLVRHLAQRVPALRVRQHAVCVVALAACAFFPLPFPAPQEEGGRYRMEDVRRLEQELNALADGRALFFSNRNLRDVLGTVTDLDTMRLLELTWFGGEEGIPLAVNWFLDQGVSVFMLDNADQDPTRAGRFNLTPFDLEQLHDRFEVVEQLALSAEAFQLGPFLGPGQDELRVFGISKREQTEVSQWLQAPEEGPAFLRVHPRSLGERLEVRLAGESISAPIPLHYYRPLPPRAWGEESLLEASAGGETVPSLHDSALVGWHEAISVEFGPDAVPGDEPWFGKRMPGPLEIPRHLWVSERRLDLPFSLWVPVRSGPDFFTTVGLSIRWLPGVDPLPEHLSITPSQGGAAALKIHGDAVWFPLDPTGPIGVERRAELVSMDLDAGSHARVGLRRARILTAHRVLRRTLDPATIGVGLRGVLAPAAAGSDLHAWQAEVNGEILAEGFCDDQPRRERNQFALIWNAPDFDGPLEVRIRGAGLLHPEWVEIGAELTFGAGDSAAMFLTDGFFAEERLEDEPFRWSSGRGLVRVPVSGAGHAYRLSLDIADGRPEHVAHEPREASVTVAGATASFVLPMQRSEVALLLLPEVGDSPRLEDLRIDCPAWVPEELVGTRDSRELGFQLFGFRWEEAASDQ